MDASERIKVAVTGGTGCLGWPLIKRLQSMGYYVRLLVPMQETIPSHLSGCDIVRGDITDEAALGKLLYGTHHVFHLAAKVHDFFGGNSPDYNRINVEGTRLLLKQSGKSGLKRFVFYSTVGVHGKDGNFSGDEQSPCSPNNPYSISKYSAEKNVLSASGTNGLEGVVLRFPMVYGALDRGNMSRMIDGIRRRRFALFGPGLNVRSMINSANAAEAAILAGFRPNCAGKVYCVTDGVDYTLNQLAETVCKCLGTTWRPPRIPLAMARAFGVGGDVIGMIAGRPIPFGMDTVRKLSTSLTFSCEKIKRELGYVPVESLAEGIAAEVKWLSTK